MKKILACLLACLLAAGLAGCSGGGGSEKGEYYLYYLNREMNQLVREPYEPAGQTPEELCLELAKATEGEAEREDCMGLLPEDVSIESVRFTEEGILNLDMSGSYEDMSTSREILVRAGLVRTFLQVEQVSKIRILVEGLPLRNSQNEEVGLLDNDSFVENSGKEINTYENATMTLYFTNESGDGLTAEQRNIYYSTNVPLERVVLESLIKGSEDAGLQATISPNTKILGVSIVDGICYVNLDKTFMTEAMSVQEELPIYSIVNSLTDACGVHGVQISVEGETKATFRESMNLDMMYKADYSLLNDDEEGSDAQTAASEKGEK